MLARNCFKIGVSDPIRRAEVRRDGTDSDGIGSCKSRKAHARYLTTTKPSDLAKRWSEGSVKTDRLTAVESNSMRSSVVVTQWILPIASHPGRPRAGLHLHTQVDLLLRHRPAQRLLLTHQTAEFGEPGGGRLLRARCGLLRYARDARAPDL